jgi:hypothetical protein
LTIDPDLESCFEITADAITLSENITMHNEKTTDDGKLTGTMYMYTFNFPLQI